MIFLTKQDFRITIDEFILDELIDYPEVADPASITISEQALINAANAILDLTENSAIEEAKGYLNSRYVVDEIFNKIGSQRNGMIVLRIVDMALYQMHAIINPKVIPDIRLKRYDDAIDWFKHVNQGMINPPDLPKPNDGSKNSILFGSNKKREHYF